MRTALILILSGLLLPACGGTSQSVSARAAAPQPLTVTIFQVEEQPFERTVTLNGTLAAEEQVEASFRVTGRIEQILVDLGSPVHKGQVVAKLMAVDYALRVQQANAALQQALARLGMTADGEGTAINPERTALVRQNSAVRDQARLQRDRVKTFFDRGLSSRADLDAADAALEVAEGRYQDALEEIRNRQGIVLQRRSEMDLAREQLEGTELKSPIDGAVKERQASAGEHRTPGQPVMTIVKTDPLRLRLAVPERAAVRLRQGQSVRVHVEGDPIVHDGHLVRLGAAIDEANRTLPVEAAVSNPRGLLRPGTFSTVEIVVNEKDHALVVPQSALLTFAGVQKVVLVKDGKAHEQRVKVGRRADSRVEIVEGLKAGDVVVVNPGNIVDGTPVRTTRAG